MPTKPRYTYDAKTDRYDDMGVKFGQGEVDRIKREYPQKMKANEQAAKDFPPAKRLSEFANKTLSHDLEEISAAEAASAAHGRDKGEVGKKWKDTFK